MATNIEKFRADPTPSQRDEQHEENIARLRMIAGHSKFMEVVRELCKVYKEQERNDELLRHYDNNQDRRISNLGVLFAATTSNSPLGKLFDEIFSDSGKLFLVSAVVQPLFEYNKQNFVSLNGALEKNDEVECRKIFGRMIDRASNKDKSAEPLYDTGVVKWFNMAKGFGFIAPDGGGQDVFVRVKAIERSGLTGLREGQAVSFDIENDPEKNKPAAVNIKPI